MTVGQFESLLNGFTAEADGFHVAARLIMSSSEGRIEQRVLRIVRAHADGSLDVVDGLVEQRFWGDGRCCGCFFDALFRQVCVSLTCREASLDHYAGRQATLTLILGCCASFSKESEA